MQRRENIKKYPAVFYFILCYGISWTGALLVALPTLIKRQPFQKMVGLIMFPVMLLGPPLAGLILTSLQSGRDGIRALGQRMRRWKIQGGIYLCSFILPPLLILLILNILRYFISPTFRPNFFPQGVLFGIFAGFLEEIGWMGYAYPTLRKKFSAPSAALILGLLWGIWHLPVIDFLGAAFPHGSSLPLFMVAFCSAITGVRLLICWIYENTGSVLYAQFMHAVSTGSLVMFGPAMVTPAAEALWYGCYATLLFIIIASGYIIYLKKNKSL
jgi:CAAX protease family protein